MLEGEFLFPFFDLSLNLFGHSIQYFEVAKFRVWGQVEVFTY